MVRDELEDKWKKVDHQNGGFIKLDVKHRLEWFAGYEIGQEKSLLFLTHIEPRVLNASKSINVIKRLRTDGLWTITFVLTRKEQDDVYKTLCADIISYSQKAENEAVALSLIYKRYKQWNKLLEYQGRNLMDENVRKGLLGELLYLEKVINSGYSKIKALKGWVGPDGADQDFVYSDGWHEVKTIGKAKSFIEISSLEQLDIHENGEIVVIYLDKCAPEREGAISLGEQVDRILKELNDEERLLFELKISKYGYIDLQEYKEQKYICDSINYYTVDDTFPRLTKKVIPEQIISVEYSLSLTSLEKWRRESK